MATGPDVEFCIADMDTRDDMIEVISSQFFNKQVTLHSIQRGLEPKVTFAETIDEHCGQAYGSILANLDVMHARNEKYRCVLDSGSTVPCLEPGDAFSHLLLTSHECSYATDNRRKGTNNALAAMYDGYVDGNVIERPYSTSFDDSASSSEGGSLFAYRVPKGKGAWKTEPWKRTKVASGFKVNGQLKNMINPGAPGFVYTFHARKDDAQKSKRPLIAVAGDCAESAYIFRPENHYYDDGDPYSEIDRSTSYTLMAEIQCGATVGSIGIGYDCFSSAEQESGYAKLYVSCYEKDRILVFGLGSGEDDDLSITSSSCT